MAGTVPGASSALAFGARASRSSSSNSSSSSSNSSQGYFKNNGSSQSAAARVVQPAASSAVESIQLLFVSPAFQQRVAASSCPRTRRSSSQEEASPRPLRPEAHLVARMPTAVSAHRRADITSAISQHVWAHSQQCQLQHPPAFADWAVGTESTSTPPQAKLQSKELAAPLGRKCYQVPRPQQTGCRSTGAPVPRHQAPPLSAAQQPRTALQLRLAVVAGNILLDQFFVTVKATLQLPLPQPFQLITTPSVNLELIMTAEAAVLVALVSRTQEARLFPALTASACKRSRPSSLCTSPEVRHLPT